MNLDSFLVKLSFYQLGDLATIFSDRTTVYQRSVPEKADLCNEWQNEIAMN